METFDIVKKKIDRLMEMLDPTDLMKEPGDTINGRYTDRNRFTRLGGWTHSFFLGMVGLMYEHTNEKKYLDYLMQEKENYWDYLLNKQYRVSHDVGFLYILYAVMLYKYTGDMEMRNMAIKAADELGKRYQFECGVITAFTGVIDGPGLDCHIAHIIPDDMMNICLLMWAYEETKHSFYKNVYKNHIQTSIQYLVRDDFSVRHGYLFDNQTGAPICETNHCGYSIGSHWARGTAWVIFSLVRALKCTGDRYRYLQPLIGITEKYLNELGDQLIPAWDFNIPGGWDGKVDTSAAAIVACAFDEMKNLGIEHPLFERCIAHSDAVYEELQKYMADDEAENIIDKAQCGEGQVGTLWGDYFFVELMMRKSGKCVIDVWC